MLVLPPLSLAKRKQNMFLTTGQYNPSLPKENYFNKSSVTRYLKDKYCVIYVLQCIFIVTNKTSSAFQRVKQIIVCIRLDVVHQWIVLTES